VQKEVGKVGTESPTFIEPIANRKDGIQAMFSRQKRAQSSSAKNTPQKRKRSASPSTSRTIKPSVPVETEVPSSKKLKEDQDEVVICLDHSPTPVCSSTVPNPRQCIRSLLAQGITQQILFSFSNLTNTIQNQSMFLNQ
jgi:hypothetical protein